MLCKEVKKEVVLERVFNGAEHGFEASKFHELTDDVSERILVVENEYGTIFGGYVTKSCNNIPDKWLDDPNAFIYQFSPETKVFRTKEANGHHAFYKNKSKIMEFSNDIELSNKCNENKDSFAKPERYKITKGKDLVGGDSDEDKVYYKVTKLELFKVIMGADIAAKKAAMWESNIIDDNDKDSFIELIGTQARKGINIERVYSSIDDGLDVNEFHAKTDDLGERLIIIKNEYDTVFGGFATQSVSSATDKWINDPEAFLFQFRPFARTFPVRRVDGYRAYHVDKKHLVCFGNDLEIQHGCMDRECSYVQPVRYKFDKGKDLVGGYSTSKKVNFKVREIEVFKVESIAIKSEILGRSGLAKAFLTLMTKGLKKQCRLERVYNALEDSFEASTFHSKTDAIADRVILVETDYGSLFGGYVSVSCNDIPDKWLDDPKAFIYQLKPRAEIFRTKEANGMI